MESVNRYLNVAYLALGLLSAWLFAKISGMVFDLFGPRADRLVAGDLSLSALVGVVAGVGFAVFCWRSPKIYKWATEVTVELSRVTWPENHETKRSTYVVIMFSIVSAIILAAFDFFWKFTTDLIL